MIITGIEGLRDPYMVVCDDAYYLYGTLVKNNGDWKDTAWGCYKNEGDLTSGKWALTKELVYEKPANAEKNFWAPEVHKYNGKYYFYTCSWSNKDNGKQSIGVAVSDSPTGPFVDIGKELVKGSQTLDETHTWEDIDPTVWIETDENGVEHRYLCWGNTRMFICELNEDMISVKDLDGDGKITYGTDIINKIPPKSFTEAPWIYRRQDENGNYYGEYYLFYAYGWREQMAYATTDDLLYGEWKFGGVIMEPTASSDTNHMSVIDFGGKTYFIYHNGSLPAGNGYRRVACIEEMFFNDNGKVQYIQETSTGISGTACYIKDLDGNKLSHEYFKNSSSDGDYPYKDLTLGMNLAGAKDADMMWEIIPGKTNKLNEFYVSIEAYNKPGLFVTASTKAIKLSHDSTSNVAVTLGKSQTFITVKGLAGEGVSFESVKDPGKYITVKKGMLVLSDGSDPRACTFVIEPIE